MVLRKSNCAGECNYGIAEALNSQLSVIGNKKADLGLLFL